MIPRLPIPGSGISLCRVGFGCARIYGGSELKAAARLIDTALVAGVRHFDTAPSYGNGHSEAVLGTVLAGVPDIMITTKIGIPRPDLRVQPRAVDVAYRRLMRPLLSRLPGVKTHLLRLAERRGSRSASLSGAAIPRRRLERGEVLRNLEESLKQLKRTTIDLYLLHEPNQFELTDELRELFLDLQRDGVVGAFGLAFGGIADIGTGFGTVVQGRYVAGLPSRCPSGEVRIFHGALRYGQQGADSYAGVHKAGVWLNQVLATHPDTAVIFSASSPHQIKSVLNQFAP